MANRAASPERTGDPSAWRRRAPVVCLALVGCAIATYLTLYQWGVTVGVWDPLFGRGSEIVLTSGLAGALPIPDAALGAVAYLVEAVLGAAGGAARWRRRPWLVAAFGALVAALALTSVVLVLAQAFVFHTGCTLCLASAAISFANAWLASDEIAASVGHLRRARREGGSVWRAFWGLPTPVPAARGRKQRRRHAR